MVNKFSILRIGDLLTDRYLIEAKLGEGGTMAAYLAQDWQDQKNRVVIKNISDDFSHHPQSLQVLQHEAKILTAINHPSIVKLLADQTNNPLPFFILEYIDGINLKTALQQAEIYLNSKKLRADIIKQLKSVLKYLHAQGIIHGDIKPDNVMLQNNGKIVLIDFSLARFYKEESRNYFDPTQLHAYTPKYASENVRAGKAALPGDDWYAFEKLIEAI